MAAVVVEEEDPGEARREDEAEPAAGDTGIAILSSSATEVSRVVPSAKIKTSPSEMSSSDSESESITTGFVVLLRGPGLLPRASFRGEDRRRPVEEEEEDEGPAEGDLRVPLPAPVGDEVDSASPASFPLPAAGVGDFFAERLSEGFGG